MANERRYLDYNGLQFFWNKLKQIFQYKISNTTSDVIYLDKNNPGDSHLSLQAISDDGNTKTQLDRILPAGSNCLENLQNKYLVTAAAVKCIVKKYAPEQNKFTSILTPDGDICALQSNAYFRFNGTQPIKIGVDNSCNLIIIGLNNSENNPVTRIITSEGTEYISNDDNCSMLTTAAVTKLIEDSWAGLNMYYNVPTQTLTINCSNLPLGVTNSGVCGTRFHIANSEWQLTSNDTCSHSNTIAPTWAATKALLECSAPSLIIGDTKCSICQINKSTNTPYLNLVVNGAVKNSHKLVGSGSASVGWGSGEIVINSVDSKCTARVTCSSSKLYLVGSTQQTGTTAPTNTGASSVFTEAGYLHAKTADTGDNSTILATTAFVTNAVAEAQSGAIHFCGVWPTDGNVTTRQYKKGTYWLVSEDRGLPNALCIALEAGDMVYHTTNETNFRKNDFTVVQSNLSRITCNDICAITNVS